MLVNVFSFFMAWDLDPHRAKRKRKNFMRFAHADSIGLLGLALLIHERHQLHQIRRVHATHRARRVHGIEYFVRWPQQEFAGLDNATTVFPPGTQTIRLFPGDTIGHGIIKIGGNLAGLFLIIHAGRDDAYVQGFQGL